MLLGVGAVLPAGATAVTLENRAWRIVLEPETLAASARLLFYNTDLFAQAGIDEPPATWDELLDDVQALKEAGITPIILGGGEKWPVHFYWSYLVMRVGGPTALVDAMAGKDAKQRPAQGLVQVAKAVNGYAGHFDHPGFKPIRNIH